MTDKEFKWEILKERKRRADSNFGSILFLGLLEGTRGKEASKEWESARKDLEDFENLIIS